MLKNTVTTTEELQIKVLTKGLVKGVKTFQGAATLAMEAWVHPIAEDAPCQYCGRAAPGSTLPSDEGSSVSPGLRLESTEIPNLLTAIRATVTDLEAVIRATLRGKKPIAHRPTVTPTTPVSTAEIRAEARKLRDAESGKKNRETAAS